MRFSERQGFVRVSDVLQLAEMSSGLRNSIWNQFYLSILSQRPNPAEYYHPRVYQFARAFYIEFVKLPINALPVDQRNFASWFNNWFMNAKFFEIYDLIEFAVTRSTLWLFNGDSDAFTARLNKVLETERSGYRIVGQHVVPITSEVEIGEIERALEAGPFGHSAARHIQEAVRLLSGGAPDAHRNVVKEAISAVEAIVLELTGQTDATLGQALKKLSESSEIHPALILSFQKLYGYTSDASGIRHAISEKASVDLTEARFMLIACSAFVNFVKDRAKPSE